MQYSSTLSYYCTKTVKLSPLTMRSRTGTGFRCSNVLKNSLGAGKGVSYGDVSCRPDDTICVAMVPNVSALSPLGFAVGKQVSTREFSAQCAQNVISGSAQCWTGISWADLMRARARATARALGCCGQREVHKVQEAGYQKQTVRGHGGTGESRADLSSTQGWNSLSIGKAMMKGISALHLD